MKGPIAASVILHILLLALGVLSLSSREKLEAGGEVLPVEMVSIEELTQIQQGDQKAEKADKAAPVPTTKPADDPNAQNVGDNVTDTDALPTPGEKPKPVETVNAPKPQPKPVKKPEVKPEEEQVDAVAEAIAKEEAAAAKAAEAAKKAEAEAAKAAEKAAEKAAADKAAEQKAEEQAKIEAEALLKASAEAKAAEEEKKAADKEAKEKAAAEKAAKAEEEKAAKEAAAKAEKEAAEKAAAEAEAKAAEEAKAAKAAKAKADKEAKAAAAKKAAAAQAAEEKKLADDIKKALLNTDKGATGGKKKSTDTAALGGKKSTGGAKLSLSEMDALKGAVQRCWELPAGIYDAGNAIISVRAFLNQSGEVENVEVTSNGGGAPVARTAVEGLRRAVKRCGPYTLPAEKYDTWSTVNLEFDLSTLQ